MRFRFHPEAELELQEASLRYEGSVEGLGRRFVDEVERAIELVLEQPDLGVPVDSSLRQFVLRKFPFSLVYLMHGDLVLVVALAHGNRYPEYWRSRVHDR